MSERIICNDNGGELREEIVRCRDCGYQHPDDSDHEYREPLWCILHHRDVNPNRFCAWGIRKEQQ